MSVVKTLPLLDALKSIDLPAQDRNLFFSPEWLRVVSLTYQTKISIKFIENDEGGIRSYIVYSVVKNFLEWKICICSYCDYCDCLVSTIEDWKAFINSLQEDFPYFRIAVRNLRDALIRDAGLLSVLSKERYHYLNIRPNLENIWRRMSDSFRAAVHQSERFGVSVRPAAKGDLSKFYNSHLCVRKNKYRIFPQPYRFFDNLWEIFMENDKGVLLAAYDRYGQFIGGNIYLFCGSTAYYKFNTSIYASLKLRPNNLLFWEGIKHAKAKGMDGIDLGSSGYDQEGLIHFKNQTGAESSDITHLGYHPTGYKFSQKRILRLMTSLFTMPFVPNSLVRWGSKWIYPYLA